MGGNGRLRSICLRGRGQGRGVCNSAHVGPIAMTKQQRWMPETRTHVHACHAAFWLTLSLLLPCPPGGLPRQPQVSGGALGRATAAANRLSSVASA